MSTDRQMQVFELIAVHGCSQAEAGGMLDPPVSQTTVNRDLKNLFTIHPELVAVKDYLHLNDDFSPKNEPLSMMSYDPGMDNEIKASF